MGLFGKIGEAKFSEGGIYVLPGVYLFDIIAVKTLRTRTMKDAFVAEFSVVESSNPQRLPGSSCSWMVTFDKEPAMGNVKQFLATVLAATMEQITEAIAEAACSEANPLAGKRVRCSAVEITTKANRPFTKVKFLSADASAADIAKEHAAAGGK